MSPSPLAAGVWAVVATPFNGSTHDLDEGSLARLVEFYEEVGVVGLTVLGVFGEAAQLSSQERQAVLETVTDTTDLPLVVGATSLGTAPVIEEVRLAQEVVGEPDVAVRVGAAKLGQRRAGSGTDLRLVDVEKRSQVVVALPALEQ